MNSVDIPKPLPTLENHTPPPPEPPKASEQVSDEPAAALVDSVRERHQTDEQFAGITEIANSNMTEDNASVEKDAQEKLKVEQEAAEKQKEEEAKKQEKERLIRAGKAKLLKEKLKELFQELATLNPGDLASVVTSGKTNEGSNLQSKAMGSLGPEVAQPLAQAFKEGAMALPKLIEALPGLLQQFDENLTKEATERVEKQLEEKQKVEGEQKEKEDKNLGESQQTENPGEPESKTPPVEVSPAPKPPESQKV